MEIEKLKKGNELSQKINELNDALNCFEWWEFDEDAPKVSTNPRLIIEFDGADGREQAKVPMNLSEFLTDLLKNTIKSELEKAQSEFDKL